MMSLGMPAGLLVDSTNLDGKFHFRIEVKVARPKVSISARRGYLAGTASAGCGRGHDAAVVPAWKSSVESLACAPTRRCWRTARARVPP